MAVAAEQQRGRTVSLPRCRTERERRHLTIRDLAARAGTSWITAAKADAGLPVAVRTARAISAALALVPADETMDRLLGLKGEASASADGDSS